MTEVKPCLTVLTEEQVQTVHENALTILEKTGIRIDDENCWDMFTKTVGHSDDNGRFTIPRDLVAWAIDSAPSRVDVFCRDGRPAFSLNGRGAEHTVFGIGVTNLFYQEALNDNVVPFGRKHMAQSTRLGEALAEFDPHLSIDHFLNRIVCLLSRNRPAGSTAVMPARRTLLFTPLYVRFPSCQGPVSRDHPGGLCPCRPDRRGEWLPLEARTEPWSFRKSSRWWHLPKPGAP